MRLAVFTVSPNRQYRGMRLPTTPEQTSPVCTPARMWQGLSFGMMIFRATLIADRPNSTAALTASFLSAARQDRRPSEMEERFEDLLDLTDFMLFFTSRTLYVERKNKREIESATEKKERERERKRALPARDWVVIVFEAGKPVE